MSAQNPRTELAGGRYRRPQRPYTGSGMAMIAIQLAGLRGEARIWYWPAIPLFESKSPPSTPLATALATWPVLGSVDPLNGYISRFVGGPGVFGGVVGSYIR